jgi:hypothetical protein
MLDVFFDAVVEGAATTCLIGGISGGIFFMYSRDILFGGLFLFIGFVGATVLSQLIKTGGSRGANENKTA